VRFVRVVAAVLLALTAPGCTSNPTPHPGNGGTANYADAVDGRLTGEPTAQPDRDNDGVGDCEQAGGVWNNGECDGATLRPDGTHEPIDQDVKTGDIEGMDADAMDSVDEVSAASEKDAGNNDAKPPESPSFEEAAQ
jgi:hypothetical protein